MLQIPRIGVSGRESRVKTQRGFTLAELLVVVAIIAVFAAILLPVLYQAQDTARMRVCASNLKELGMAFRMYVDENNGFGLPFPPYVYSGSTPLLKETLQTMLPDPLKPYLKQSSGKTTDAGAANKVWICPGDRARGDGTGWYAPLWKRYGEARSSYSYNYVAYTAYPRVAQVDVDITHTTTPLTPRRVEQWARPSRDLLICDGESYFHRGRRDTSSSPDSRSTVTSSDTGINIDRTRDANASVKCINMLMLDGHVVPGTSIDATDGKSRYAKWYDNPFSLLYGPSKP